jgi:hypothetical protein
MYSHTYLPLGTATTAGTAALPFVGLAGWLWLVLAGVAMVALGGALRRLKPARQA